VIRTPRRSAGRSRVVLAAVVAAGGVLLAGCGAGQQAQTSEEIPTIDGNYAQAGSLALRDITLAYPTGGVYRRGAAGRLDFVVVNESPQSDALVEVRTDAAERATFAATGAAEAGDAAATSSAPTGSASPSASGSATPSASGSATPSGSGTPSEGATPSASPTPAEPSPSPPSRIDIPGNSLVAFRDAGPAVTLEGLTRPLRPAEVVSVTFVFERGGSVTVPVAVAVPEGEVEPAPTVPAEGGGEG
jgi:copper(I)-binding protein